MKLFLVAVLATLSACVSSPKPVPERVAKGPMPQREIVAGLMQSGRQAMTQGRFDRAIILFRRIGDNYPNAPERPEATLLLAQALEAHGDTALALTEYRRLTEEYPQTPQAVVARAKVPDLERRGVLPSPSAGPVAAYISVAQIDSVDDRELLRLQHAETDTIVLEVARQAPSRSRKPEAGVYFKTDWAPLIRDRLANIVASAHRQRMQAWAALSIRRMDWIDPQLGWSDWRFDPASGEVVPADDLDLLHPAVREYLLGLLIDLAATGIDGVFLMADPPSGAPDGFSPFALRAYQRDMEQPVDPRSLHLRAQPALSFAAEFWRWIGWKQREQLKAINGVVRAVRNTYPSLKIAFEVHPEAITNPRAALAWYSEDFLDLRRSPIDYVAVSLPSSQGGTIKPLMASMNGKRLLLTRESGSVSKTFLSYFPLGSGLIYKENVTGDGLTKDGR
jgi:tetratricopeptide (TPR) repeat protein